MLLIGCGLRVGDATRLPFDCLIRAADGAPYLRYLNHKLKREALVPIDADLERRLQEQQRRWLASCDVRDEQGRPVHLTPHQWRHTFATRLINRDVPQEVVRVLLDHDSHQMTAHYARLHDHTIRQHWQQARKVNSKGHRVTLDPAGPLAEASWMQHRLGLATASANGQLRLVEMNQQVLTNLDRIIGALEADDDEADDGQKVADAG
jgi:hypothetical protein